MHVDMFSLAGELVLRGKIKISPVLFIRWSQSTLLKWVSFISFPFNDLLIEI